MKMLGRLMLAPIVGLVIGSCAPTVDLTQIKESQRETIEHVKAIGRQLKNTLLVRPTEGRAGEK